MLDSEQHYRPANEYRYLADRSLQSTLSYLNTAPNGLRLSGERSRAERVRCSRGLGVQRMRALNQRLDITSQFIVCE